MDLFRRIIPLRLKCFLRLETIRLRVNHQDNAPNAIEDMEIHIPVNPNSIGL